MRNCPSDVFSALQICSLGVWLVFSTEVSHKAFASEAETSSTANLARCGSLPQGKLTDAELEKLVPENSNGRVRVAWGTESQEETYGFNILRADKADGPYIPVNKAIIPGEGTTNAPQSYCYEDSGLPRGRAYFYQIQEVTNSGGKTIVEGTAATRVSVKTVEEERSWLKKKAAQTPVN